MIDLSVAEFITSAAALVTAIGGAYKIWKSSQRANQRIHEQRIANAKEQDVFLSSVYQDVLDRFKSEWDRDRADHDRQIVALEKRLERTERKLSETTRSYNVRMMELANYIKYLHRLLATHAPNVHVEPPPDHPLPRE